MDQRIEWQNLKAHPVADMFPRMVGSDLESLANNIQRSGQLFPIMLCKDGSVLDGRNRLAAFRLDTLKGKTPWIETYNGELSPLDYVRCVNWERMHLSQSQRAALAALMLPDAQKKAAGRQGTRTDLVTSGPAGPDVDEKGRAHEVVAAQMGVSPTQVKRAAQIQKEAPEAFEAIQAGKSSVRAEHAKLKSAAKKEGESQLYDALSGTFKALASFETVLTSLHLDRIDIPPMDDEQRGQYLGAALRLQTELNTLIRKLQG